jgi:hypothetical protein
MSNTAEHCPIFTTRISSRPDAGTALRVDEKDLIFRINDSLNRVGGPYEMNESRIESLLADLEDSGSFDGQAYWLTMARLTELAVACAGHYADNCEFEAAGDLLVNPRRIRVHVDACGIAFNKPRHGRLSTLLACCYFRNGNGVSISRKDAACETVSPALLPYLHSRLLQSNVFSKAYPDHVSARMKRIAATIGFLAAYQAASNEDLHRRLQDASEEEKRFIASQLCRFDLGLFRWFGRRIECLPS